MTELCLVLPAETLLVSVPCSSSRCLCFVLTTFYTCISFRLQVHTLHAVMWHHELPYWTSPLPFFLLLVFLPSDSTVSRLQHWASGSAGLNVVRGALLKAQGPISLVQMHSVSLKFHANRHILFKQLWGYPQEEDCPPLSVFLVSFPWNDVQDGTQWVGQHANIRNILAAISTVFQMCCHSPYMTENAQLTPFWPNAHIIFYILSKYIWFMYNEMYCMYAVNDSSFAFGKCFQWSVVHVLK